jgi:hypothetical protein
MNAATVAGINSAGVVVIAVQGRIKTGRVGTRICSAGIDVSANYYITGVVAVGYGTVDATTVQATVRGTWVSIVTDNRVIAAHTSLARVIGAENTVTTGNILVETLTANAEVVCAKVTIIEDAKCVVDANAVLARIIGTIKVIIAILGEMQTSAIATGVNGAGLAIINYAGWSKDAIAGKGIAVVIGAGGSIIAIFRNVNAPATDAGVIGAGISVIKLASRIKDTTAIDAIVIGAG